MIRERSECPNCKWEQPEGDECYRCGRPAVGVTDNLKLYCDMCQSAYLEWTALYEFNREACWHCGHMLTSNPESSEGETYTP